ncbi:MAG TPA: hypothetical protein VK464_07670 [Symbiobacteriaceae bacterium]|jgi:hypothetical protein|nr:hypothetical protein [Symbiobacteriaceae bacterium]
MFYGFMPLPSAGAGAVNVWGIKANGVEYAGYLTVGPTANFASQSHSKNNQVNQLFGDLGNSPVWYGLVSDPDWLDHFIYDIGI